MNDIKQIQYVIVQYYISDKYYIYDTFNHMRLGGQGFELREDAKIACEKWNEKLNEKWNEK